MAKFLYIEDSDSVRNSAVFLIETVFPNDTCVTAIDYHDATRKLADEGPFDFIVSDFKYAGRNDTGINKQGEGCLDLLEDLQGNPLQDHFVIYSGTDKPTIVATLSARGISLAEERIFDKFGGASIEDAINYAIKNFTPGTPSGSTPGSTPPMATP
ncbi:MAG: hypothetical protein SFW62_02150 [Alphaproteobacteria bacterium]|nr:hypothetical protein [Alphaproteobacteria bacterium]